MRDRYKERHKRGRNPKRENARKRRKIKTKQKG